MSPSGHVETQQPPAVRRSDAEIPAKKTKSQSKKGVPLLRFYRCAVCNRMSLKRRTIRAHKTARWRQALCLDGRGSREQDQQIPVENTPLNQKSHKAVTDEFNKATSQKRASAEENPLVNKWKRSQSLPVSTQRATVSPDDDDPSLRPHHQIQQPPLPQFHLNLNRHSYEDPVAIGPVNAVKDFVDVNPSKKQKKNKKKQKKDKSKPGNPTVVTDRGDADSSNIVFQKRGSSDPTNDLPDVAVNRTHHGGLSQINDGGQESNAVGPIHISHMESDNQSHLSTLSNPEYASMGSREGYDSFLSPTQNGFSDPGNIDVMFGSAVPNGNHRQIDNRRYNYNGVGLTNESNMDWSFSPSPHIGIYGNLGQPNRLQPSWATHNSFHLSSHQEMSPDGQDENVPQQGVQLPPGFKNATISSKAPPPSTVQQGFREEKPFSPAFNNQLTVKEEPVDPEEHAYGHGQPYRNGQQRSRNDPRRQEGNTHTGHNGYQFTNGTSTVDSRHQPPHLGQTRQSLNFIGMPLSSPTLSATLTHSMYTRSMSRAVAVKEEDIDQKPFSSNQRTPVTNAGSSRNAAAPPASTPRGGQNKNRGRPPKRPIKEDSPDPRPPKIIKEEFAAAVKREHLQKRFATEIAEETPEPDEADMLVAKFKREKGYLTVDDQRLVNKAVRDTGRCQASDVQLMDESALQDLTMKLGKKVVTEAVSIDEFCSGDQIWEVERIHRILKKDFKANDKVFVVAWRGWETMDSTKQSLKDLQGSREALTEYLEFNKGVEAVIKRFQSQNHPATRLPMGLLASEYASYLEDEKLLALAKKSPHQVKKLGLWLWKLLEKKWSRALEKLYGEPRHLIRLECLFPEGLKKPPQDFKYVTELIFSQAAEQEAMKILDERPPECKCNAHDGFCAQCKPKLIHNEVRLEGNKIAGFRRTGKSFCTVLCGEGSSCPADAPCRKAPLRDKCLLVTYSPTVNGLGLFALGNIDKGTVLSEYLGDVMTEDEAKGKSSNYQYTVPGTNLVIDAMSTGNEARFVNHCCDPNVGVLVVYDGSFSSVPRVFYVALKNISKGQEILVDYHPDCDANSIPPPNASSCHCAVVMCRGFV